MDCQKVIFRAILLVFVVIIYECNARPVNDIPTEDSAAVQILRSKLIEAHERTSAHKRHAEIRLSSEISRRMEELRRIQMLNNIMAGLEPNKVYNVEDVSRYRRILQRYLRKRRRV